MEELDLITSRDIVAICITLINNKNSICLHLSLASNYFSFFLFFGCIFVRFLELNISEFV